MKGRPVVHIKELPKHDYRVTIGGNITVKLQAENAPMAKQKALHLINNLNLLQLSKVNIEHICCEKKKTS